MFGFSLLLRLGIYMAVGLGLVGGLLAYRHSVYLKGRDDALAAVAEQNGIAANAAKKIELTSDLCFDGGGIWSVITGECEPDAATE